MLNAIIYLKGRPSLSDTAPDIFKMTTVMRDMELMVERDHDEDTNEPAITLTLSSKNKNSFTACFSLKELRTRENNDPDMKDDGCPVYKDMNSLNICINYIQELIMDNNKHMAHIWINLDFLNDPDESDPIELNVINPYTFKPGTKRGPFDYSYCMYKNMTEKAYKELIKTESGVVEEYRS